MKVSCIIPAYNEAPRIEGVLKACLDSNNLTEIIVVDDCSKDNLEEIMKNYPAIRYIRLSENQGKSRALCRGVRAAGGDILVFVDADLMNLKGSDIDRLIDPVLQGEVDMTLSLRNIYPGNDVITQSLGIDHLTGERAFKKGLIYPHLDAMEKLSGFAVETFINKLVVKYRYSLRVIRWDHVRSPLKSFKHKRSGFFVDALDYISMWRAVFSEASPYEVVCNMIIMKKLIKPAIPSISLIIPAYNEERYIADTLSRLKERNWPFEEIIVVDNASTDNTKKIAEYFGVKVIHESKKGVLHARERGYSEAAGELIAFIDADSYHAPNWFETVTNEFQESSLACLSGPCMYFDMPAYQKMLVSAYWVCAMPVYYILGYMMISGNFIVRKDVIEKMGGFDTSIEFYGDDTNFARRAKQFGKVKFTSQCAIFTSARRLKDHGVIKTFYLYVTNFFSEVLFHKPVGHSAKDVR